MYTLNYKITVACGHYLKDSDTLTTKKCLNQHGHNYLIQLIIKTESLTNGMVMDFGKLKEIIDKYDHKNLNDFFENPTTELFAYQLHSDILSELKQGSVEVIINESEKGSISYTK